VTPTASKPKADGSGTGRVSLWKAIRCFLYHFCFVSALREKLFVSIMPASND
jgi:hypothetical protein